ncbi:MULTISPECIES: RNA polymerase sigma factor [Bacteroides]|jgi:RNA polymerase sigma-70 factor (ECF subfamily)|uniref:RNA polymerase sigma factor n=1 Tax=Bacteroides TaxID=816 RepID=UPI000C75892C|nr:MULTISPECIES: RNA polymerase sigma factor [Bacteroides]RGM46186.1 RNA polymerase sigma factor [Bacteroides sp. OM08-11]
MINEDKVRQTYISNRERGFKMLMDYFQEPIYHYIRRLVVLHEDAQDVLQEVFIQVYRHWEQFRNESSLSTWIYRIATNESLRLLNNRKNRETISTEDVQEMLIDRLRASDYIDYENELVVRFQKALLRLPEKQRVVFNLRYYDELEYEEIARILDTKVDTLKVNYHYAKEKIKEYILNG